MVLAGNGQIRIVRNKTIHHRANRQARTRRLANDARSRHAATNGVARLIQRAHCNEHRWRQSRFTRRPRRNASHRRAAGQDFRQPLRVQAERFQHFRPPTRGVNVQHSGRRPQVGFANVSPREAIQQIVFQQQEFVRARKFLWAVFPQPKDFCRGPCGRHIRLAGLFIYRLAAQTALSIGLPPRRRGYPTTRFHCPAAARRSPSKTRFPPDC